MEIIAAETQYIHAGADPSPKTAYGVYSGILAAAVNNQLATTVDGKLPVDREILYAADYVINAGGVFSLAYDYLHPGNEQGAVDQISKIGMQLTGIFHLAREQSLPTNEIADRLAQQRSVKRGGHTTNVA